MEWCLDFEDPKRLLNQEIATLDINFIKELNWNDVAVIQKETNTHSTLYSIAKENKKAYALEINWYK